MIRRAFLAVLIAAFASPAIAAEEVDVALVLAVDSSGSVDAEEFALQRRGYAGALTHPEVLGAIRRGAVGAIAVAVVEWSGPTFRNIVVDWTKISDQASAEGVAAKLLGLPRTIFGGGTAVGAAIDLGMDMLAKCPFAGIRRTIDVSGDGINNRGRAPDVARDEAVAQRVTINGLAIVEFGNDIEAYYRNHVIGGPGAFVIRADGFADFARAVRRKLILEIALAGDDAG
jgi:Protein of unknown function (DUF1194)